MNKLRLSSLLSGAFIFSMSAQAAKIIYIDENNINNYLATGTNTLVGKNNDYQFSLANKVVLPNGTVNKKYNLFYKGVPVFDSILTSSDSNTNQISWYGHMTTDIEIDNLDVTPTIDKTTALQISKSKVQLKKNDQISNEKAELFVRLNENDKAELIYLVSFNVEGYNVQRPYSMINAHTGKTISSWNGLTTRDAEGPGGNQKIGSYTYGRDFGFLNVSDTCQMTNTDVDTYDMQNQTTGGSIYRFACPGNSTDRPVNNGRAANGAYSPLNDGHYFASMVLEMYRNWYALNPLKVKFKVRVHYGKNYENAFWDGQQMTFGDGGNNLYPLTALDVMGHEVSHGVTEFNSGLLYTGQSGGINEAFSDMAGETVEDYMNKQVGKDNDWLMGASIMKNQVAMRYMMNPTKDGASIDNAKNYNDSMDVHFTSGVFNKAFYNLATSPNWDIKKAFGTFLLANQTYWQKNATFNSAGCGVAKAAKDLGYDVNDVLSAFRNVGVDANCNVTDPQTDDEVVLNNGTVINGINITAGDQHRYMINVPVLNRYPYTYDILYIQAFNAANNAKANVQLYVRYENGSMHKLDIARDASTGNEFFAIQKPAAGNYHILLKGVAAGSVNLSAVYGNMR